MNRPSSIFYRISIIFLFILSATGAVRSQTAGSQTASQTAKTPDVIYIPTPASVVKAMLQMARVGPGDVVYDLGSGDGRIVISAVKDFGAERGLGVEIDEERIQEANANAKRAGVGDRVRFIRADLFETDLHEATVVTLYLLPSLNLQLRPKLQAELQPGTRVVSHAFDMRDWRPNETRTVDGRMVYLWVIQPPVFR